jgi:hypothetical protein
VIGESYLGPARKIVGGVVICAAILPAAADAGIRQPLRFFEGRTEMQAVVKVIMKRPYRSKTLGQGRILRDGSLALLQQVYDEGQAPEQRRWKVRQVAPGRYAGTMTDAIGPVAVDEVNGRYRFKFTMKGDLDVEQWLTPAPDGNSAQSALTVRKFGMKVASSTGFVRRI